MPAGANMFTCQVATPSDDGSTAGSVATNGRGSFRRLWLSNAKRLSRIVAIGLFFCFYSFGLFFWLKKILDIPGFTNPWQPAPLKQGFWSKEKSNTYPSGCPTGKTGTHTDSGRSIALYLQTSFYYFKRTEFTIYIYLWSRPLLTFVGQMITIFTCDPCLLMF